jgi:diguanylate cyclase (GGDEF)-like protein
MSPWRKRGRSPKPQDEGADPALHDPLTTLPGRLLFHDRLERALARSIRRRSTCAVLSLSLGDPAEDAVLIDAGARLDACLRPEDSVARTAGDEFMVLLETVRDTDEAVAVAERIVAALQDLHIGASLGIALGRGGRDRAEDVLQNAEVALHRARENGRASYEVFRQEMASHPSTRLDLESELRRAVAADRLYVEYQPEVELATGRIVAVEALLRWAHAPAAEFVPVAEETGLILPLGRKLIREACEQLAGWPPEVRLSVNLSGRQLQQPRARLLDEVGSAIAASGSESDRLWVEITESAVLEDQDAALEAMQALERLGVRLAVDDFGTGYSSLTYLRRFPIHLVKIDRSFVAELTGDPEGAAIVRALIEVCHALHATVLGEGVETEEQATKLRELGAELGQGRWFHPPMGAEELRRVLAAASPGRKHAARPRAHGSLP